jgi:hypothetical protein
MHKDAHYTCSETGHFPVSAETPAGPDAQINPLRLIDITRRTPLQCVTPANLQTIIGRNMRQNGCCGIPNTKCRRNFGPGT